MADIAADHATVTGFREGAHYVRMDLHTHTPASECSSFTLPAAVQAVFPTKPARKNKAYRDACHGFLTRVAAGGVDFGPVFGDAELTARPRLTPLAPPDADALARIAAVWLGDIERGADRDDCVAEGLRDLERYLAASFFPEEFVLRCHIEELQLVALTDHNHPGYVVPRVPALGTWFDAVNRANAPYLAALTDGAADTVRQALIRRLELAERRLTGRPWDEAAHETAETRRDHADTTTSRADAERLAHVRARLAHWRGGATPAPLSVLPGTEVTVSNVHLLCVFPPDWWVPGRIGAILRTIGIGEGHWGRGFLAAASASVQDTIALVHEAGGVAIPAHANSRHKGLLHLFRKGLALSRVLDHPALLAMEKIDGAVISRNGGSKSRDACETLRWLDGGHSDRDPTKPLCFVKGSDAHECRIELDGTGGDLGERYTWVKLDLRHRDRPVEVFRALRLALQSAASRVIEHETEDGYNYAAGNGSYRVPRADRRELLACATARPTILGLTVAGRGSYARGIEVRFNPFLNCVVGSGGKSTLVRLVGYGFGALSFWKSSATTWLPERVRVFWRDGGGVHCVERRGRHFDPNDDAVAVRRFRLDAGGWTPVAESPAGQPLPAALRDLRDVVDVWPSQAEQDDPGRLPRFEEALIDRLVDALQFRGVANARPLLLNQPRDIFDNRRVFEAVLSAPILKARQMIWSTGSPNVPTALDAEKIIVTGERQRGGKTRMELVAGGDFHEEEIQALFLDTFEGGPLAFRRRSNLYHLA